VAGLAVVIGAFGAHALKERLTPEMASVFETGVRYHMYHALALLAVGWATARWASSAVGVAGWAFLGGIVLFSGSLYILALSGVRAWGAVAPVGGLAFIAGWASLAWAALRGTALP
jgi:uncharacterized membrane protein YgdD (TMEM256/DUF423 family)